ADAETLEFTAIHMWEYCWGFIVGSVNSMLSAYFYSTKRSGQAIALNVVRSLVMNSLIITFLPKLFGSAVVWHAFGIYEALVLMVALTLKKISERKGIIYR
ncbi:MAG: MATE family efflux transporter, partial [Eubacteriales bacterium]